VRLLIRWLVSAISLLIVAYFVPGFVVKGFFAALLAAVVVGFINATLGLLLKILTFPFSLLTFGLFLIVVNAMMLKVAAALTPGFQVRTWGAALLGAILLSLVSWFLNWLIRDQRRQWERRY
jgi:putative membrane protein